MTDEELSKVVKAFARRQPFRPYLLEFNSGQAVKVSHPEAVCAFSEFWLHRSTSGDHCIFKSYVVTRAHDAKSS